MQICVITNVYNETRNFPLWHQYYSGQFGKEHLFVLDHGADDGSTSAIKPANYLRLPRTKPYNESARFRLINNLVNDLLSYYDWLIYTDCDEILVADPGTHADLRQYLARASKPVCYAIGLNLRHLVSQEPALRAGEKILQQRSLVQFVGPMCKPLITRQPIKWQQGFHGADAEPAFDDLYLLHLRYANLDWTLERLRVTRTLVYSDRTVPRYEQSDDDIIRTQFQPIEAFAIDEAFDLSPELAEQTARYRRTSSDIYAAGPAYFGKRLHRLPTRFRDLF